MASALTTSASGAAILGPWDLVTAQAPARKVTPEALWVYLVAQIFAGFAAGVTFLVLNPDDK